MKLRQHYSPAPGYTPLVAPPDYGFARLEFGILCLAPGETFHLAGDGRETGVVILTGSCAVTCGDLELKEIGGRQSVFDGRASAVYAPRHCAVRIESRCGAEIALCRAPTTVDFPPCLVQPDEVIVDERGGNGFRRLVHDVIGAQVRAGSILIGETFTPAGNWSGYPPHKHDSDDYPHEAAQEEIYFFKVRPEHGFGIQYLYSTAGRESAARAVIDEAQAVRHNDLSVIPYGYHPVAAPPGYDIYYLWFLAGPNRLLLTRDDPAHAWIASAEQPPRHYPR